MADRRSRRNTSGNELEEQRHAMKTTKQSTFGATLRTTILLASLSGLLVVIGALIGGPDGGALPRLRPADQPRLLLLQRQIGAENEPAKPIEESENPRLFQIVRELTTRAGLPMPRGNGAPKGTPAGSSSAALR